MILIGIQQDVMNVLKSKERIMIKNIDNKLLKQLLQNQMILLIASQQKDMLDRDVKYQVRDEVFKAISDTRFLLSEWENDEEI